MNMRIDGPDQMGPAGLQAAAAISPPVAPVPAPSVGDGSGVKVDTIPATPPPELQAQFAIASQAYDRLAAQQRGLHFRVDQHTGKVVVEVHDTNGKLLYSVPNAKALKIAGGADLDE
jgi:hypothetical protein